MKNKFIFLILNVMAGGPLIGMERQNISFMPREISESVPKIQNVVDVPTLLQLALEKRKEQKFSEAVTYYNMFHYRLLQDVECAINISKEKLCATFEKQFSQIDNQPYTNFIDQADENLIGAISLRALEWADSMNRKKKLPDPKWLLKFQENIHLHSQDKWTEKRAEALEKIKKEFEDFSC